MPSTPPTAPDVLRGAPATPRTDVLACHFQALGGTCIGCHGCIGICTALLDVVMLPDAVLKPKASVK